MLLPNRHASTDDYRYGFNGKEKDDEIKGIGLQYDYGFRIYDPRIGKFLSQDPLFASYPYYTPYQFAGNNPIWAIDLDGLEELVTNQRRRVQNFRILNSSNKPIQGVVDVVYYREGKLVREYRQSGTYVLKEGYDGGPEIIEDIVLKRQNKYAPDLHKYDGSFRMLFKYTNKMTEVAATKPPPYSPKAFKDDSDESTTDIDTENDKKVGKKIPKIKSGSTSALISGMFFPSVDTDNGGVFFESDTGGFPGQKQLQSIVDGLNNSPKINTIELRGSISHGDGVSDFKAKNAMIMGLNKLKGLMKKMGLRNGIQFDIKTREIEAPSFDSPDSKSEINFKFLEKNN